MSEITYHHKLPYILPSQAQKHVTHNEALRMLDAIVHLGVDEIGIAVAPTEPTEGQRFIIGQNASGIWDGRNNQVAAFVDEEWFYFQPAPGWLAWSKIEQALYVFSADGWEPINSNAEQLALLGINGAASETERLVVQSQSILFNHGGNNLRVKLNKAQLEDTASILFQTGFEGRVEFGLPGDDHFTIKVSNDGQEWKDAIRIDNETGGVDFTASGLSLDSSLFQNLLPDSGRFTSSSKQHLLIDVNPQMPAYLGAFNNASITFPAGFIHNNSTYGGSRAALDPVIEELIVKIFGANGVRYGPEFHVMQIDAGDGAAAPITVDGEVYHRQLIGDANPRPSKYTTGFFTRAISQKIALRPPSGSVRTVLRNGQVVEFGSGGVVVQPSDGWVYFEMQLTRSNLYYDQNDLALNMLPQASGYLALPRVVAGWVSLGGLQGVVPNSQLFER